MAKIVKKAGLTLGTNLKLHIADKGGVDIAIDVTGATLNITSSSTNFTSSSETGGVVNRAIAVGDVIKLSHTTNAANEGVTATVTAVTANSITATTVSGSPVDEVAGSDINITTFKKTYQFLAAGGLSFVDGVAGIILASKLVDLWDSSDLDKYDRVFASIEPRAKSIASINGWEPHDANTVNAIRDTAMEVRASATSAATKIYALFRSGNLHASTDQFYFWYSGDAELTAPQQAVMTGYINQLFLIYDSPGSVDHRGTWYTRCATPGKTIVMEGTNAQYAEIYPVSAANAIDPKLGNAGGPYVSDVTIAAGGIYANIDYNLDVDGVYSGDVNGTPYNFAGCIDADGQANDVVHAKVNYLLRQPTNINVDGTGAVRRGDKQFPLTSFSGDVITVNSYLMNYKSSQRNNLHVVDTDGTVRQWPTIFTLTVNAAALAVGGSCSLIHEDTFGTSSAVYLKNDQAVDQRDITITASKDIVVAYSTYNTGGHSPGTPLALRLTYNRPGYIEPDSVKIVFQSDTSVTIQPTADPSYTAA